MEVKAVARQIRMSPTKIRPVADLVRGKKVDVALAELAHNPKTAARIIRKVLLSAMANAENNLGLDVDRLMVSTIAIDQGPTLKRFMARARGRGSRILKRTSHITVAVAERD
ncbi:MAG: 50S ribosomal protein L22 [Alphaproteobacteria bacterium CG_4_10_14_0_2_um_filter_63_37]|nr:MAG: 50S ribosomal protein L22 [Proteobacteria bacterium CG1_02_64_396]PJA25557.1 MAG: 50S ribosomal protein L22 [Alphaproteobacteria bacterium CG_4_10_14_0_2_um_filter_63_37]